jgi:hypothetical protein
LDEDYGWSDIDDSLPPPPPGKTQMAKEWEGGRKGWQDGKRESRKRQ